MKKIILLSGVALFTITSALCSMNNSKNHDLTLNNDGSNRSDRYKAFPSDSNDALNPDTWKYSMSQAYKEDTNSKAGYRIYDMEAKDQFNFVNRKNVLIVFQTTQNYIATYHVNDIADTNPTSGSNAENGLEFDSDKVYANSVDIFTSDKTIYFSAHPNAGSCPWHNYTINPSHDTNITVLRLGGTAFDMTTGWDYPVQKDASGKDLPASLEDEMQWASVYKHFGKSQTFGAGLPDGDGGNGLQKQFFHAFADALYNYDHPGAIDGYSGFAEYYANTHDFVDSSSSN